MNPFAGDSKPQGRGLEASPRSWIWFVCKWGGLTCLIAAFALAPIVFLLQVRMSDEGRRHRDDQAALRRAKASPEELERREAEHKAAHEQAFQWMDAVAIGCALLALVGLVAAPVGFLAAPVRCHPVVRIAVGGSGLLLIVAFVPVYLAAEAAENRVRETEARNREQQDSVRRAARSGALAAGAEEVFERDVVPSNNALAAHERNVTTALSGGSVGMFAGGTILLALAAVGLRGRQATALTLD